MLPGSGKGLPFPVGGSTNFYLRIFGYIFDQISDFLEESLHNLQIDGKFTAGGGY